MAETCPICLQNEVDSITECNHSFCVKCLCRVKKCPICRKSLNKSKICDEIIKLDSLSNIDTSSIDSLFEMGDNSFVAREETNSIPPITWHTVWSA
jgi:hypothetical protein